MTVLQEQAVEMIHGLSDDNVSFLIEVIQHLMPQDTRAAYSFSDEKNKKLQAFKELDAARAEIKKYLPDDFDPDQELKEARAERYGSVG